MRKDRLDGRGWVVLVGVTALLALNQILMKRVSEGLEPVFAAGLRSLMAAPVVGAWLWYRGLMPRFRPQADLWPGLAMGLIFAAEFLGLFLAIDLSSVGRASVLFYSMPIWMAVLAHYTLPGEGLTRWRVAGLVVAFVGTAWALLAKNPSGQGSFWGDLAALVGAWGWVVTAWLARVTRLRSAGPEVQLFWMVLVSAPVLLILAPAFGPALRAVEPWHWGVLVFQAVVVVAGGFVTWLWLISVYPTGQVAAFSFTTPLLTIVAGHLVLGEAWVPGLFFAACLVGAGVALINLKR